MCQLYDASQRAPGSHLGLNGAVPPLVLLEGRALGSRCTLPSALDSGVIPPCRHDMKQCSANISSARARTGFYLPISRIAL